MTDAQRELMHARQKVESFYLFPIKNFLEAAQVVISAEKARADIAEETLETLRPVWAEGFTSDSNAAQVTAGALGEIWRLLGVENQTAAMEKLRGLVG